MKTVMMTVMIAVVASFLGAPVVRAADSYETRCKQGDCFKSGWMTLSDDKSYQLDTSCKMGDCARFGWSSLANDGSTYDVTCFAKGCFVEGWHSIQDTGTSLLLDDVTCQSSSCLTVGWKVQTGYDLMGGDVACNSSDCSRFGGQSFWRGRPSHTSCFNEDCYHQGWTLYID